MVEGIIDRRLTFVELLMMKFSLSYFPGTVAGLGKTVIAFFGTGSVEFEGSV